MINIMYLVLLAMLALNVSDTILNAFKNINDSLALSKQNVSTGIDQLFEAFESTKLKEQPERAKPIYDKAVKARELADKLNADIEKLKERFVSMGGGYDEETGDLKSRDNLDIAPGLMVNQGEAKKLREKINSTRDQLLALLDEKDRKGLYLGLGAEDAVKSINGKKKWEEINFGEGTPLTAAMTILTKIQTDTKNAENEIVKIILGKMDMAVVNLDKFEAVAVAPTSYVLQGQPYNAEVFLTAYDSRSNPSISVNGSPISVSNGRGKYALTTTKEGVFTWTGSIKVQQTDGSVKEYSTGPQKYQVARPSAVVSPDKMNVFYIGVPNPVSISAPGIPAGNLKLSMQGGSISGHNGKYTVNVSAPGEAEVAVAAELAPGKVQTIGTTKFRIKRIPDPVARFAGKSGGTLNSVAIKSQSNVFAVLENFDFDAKFQVTRFSLIIAKPRADAIVLQTTGNSLNAAMTAALASIGPGSRVIFDNIIAVGPDGSQRALNSIALTAN